MSTEPDDVPPYAYDRMNELLETDPNIARAFARYIAQHEEAPVDPDVEALERILTAAAGYTWKPHRGLFEIALAQYKKEIGK